MTKIYCDVCKKEVKKESELDWIDISPHYRRCDDSWTRTWQTCSICVKKVEAYLENLSRG